MRQERQSESIVGVSEMGGVVKQ